MMNFAVWRLSREPTKIVSFSASSAGVCAARVACEDIRQEFGVQVSNEDLCDLATIRGTNNETLSEIANRRFEAGQAKLIDLADHVMGWREVFHFVEISREDLAARRTEFAWGEYDIPEAMGMPAPSLEKMPIDERKAELERDIVDRLLRSLCQFSLSNPSAEAESGADVLAKFPGCEIGFQVTQYRSDAGRKGSSSRREEHEKAAAGLPAAMFIGPTPLPALAHIIEDKSKKGWSQKEFPDMRLLIVASLPQTGGTASTFLFEPRLDVNEMNAQLAPILEQTRYSAAYLHIMMPGSVYQWKRETRWRKLL